MVGRLNHLSAAAARRRADELLERFGLTEAARPQGRRLLRRDAPPAGPGGSLVVAPAVLFVDEPTTGLDPQGRREVWAAIRELVSGGTTVLLTTQYLEEADQLADRISMLRGGVVVAAGTPEELKAAIGGDWLESPWPTRPTCRGCATWPRRSPPATCGRRTARDGSAIPVAERTRALVGLSAALAEAGVEPLDIAVRRPTLDEVFLHMMTDGPSVAPTTPR